MSEFQEKLPRNWIATTLGELCSQPQYGYTTKGSDIGTLRLLRTTDITSGEICWEDVPFCLENPTDEAKYLLEDGDIVISRAGSVGVSYLLRKPERSVFASYLIRFKPYINTQYFKYFLDSPYYWQEIADNKLGIAVPNVNASKLKEIAIPLPPENEQHRIVAKIEELFSELDKGIENLKTAREQLKVYRQALLKHAFEGKLTAQWREERRAKQSVSPAQAGAHPLNDMDSRPTPSRGQALRGNDEVGGGNDDPLEPAAALLARIQTEREQRYRQQLQQWQATGGSLVQRAGKPKAPKPLPPLTAEELAELPELPEGWGWCKLGDFIDSIDAGKSFKCDERKPHANEIGVAKVSAVTWGEYDESESKTCTDNSKENKAYLIRSGDFILSRANTIDLVGACVIARKVSRKIMLSDKTLRIRFDGFSQEYFLLYLGSRIGRKQIMRLSTGNQESMRNIGQDRIRSIAVPICSGTEAESVIEALASKLSEADQLELTLAASLQQSEALRQSILKKAFSGQLVAQDANDEPAAALLARIRAERATGGKGETIQRRTRKVSA